MTLEAMMEEIRALPVRERKRLISMIVETLPDDGQAEPPRKRSITELLGLGKDLWQGIDAQKYVDELRSEWDERPLQS